MWVVFFLIVYFVNSYEVPQTIMDVALYEITYYYLYPADAYTGRDLSLFATINKQELLLLIKVI
jgi:hypothetical protein